LELSNENITPNPQKPKKNPYVTSVIFIAVILLFATFVAYPYQSALGHDSPKHSFCFDSTLNAFDFTADYLFALIDFVTFLLFGPPKPPLAALLKTFVALAILGAGAALSLVCAPELSQPTSLYRIYLPCNFAGFKGSNDEGLIGFKVSDEKYTDQKNISYFGEPFRYWNSDGVDDRISPTNPIEDVTTFDTGVPILGSFRHSLFSATDDRSTSDVEGTRVGFTTFYAAESSFVWLSFTAPTIFDFLITIIGTLLPVPGGKLGKILDTPVGKFFFGFFKILLGVAVALLFAEVLNYKNLIRAKDGNSGVISHPVLRNFEISSKDDGVLTSDGSKLFELGSRKITYLGGAINHGIDDNVPAKFYFNVIDSFPPFLNLQDNKVTIVEANTHWGFQIEPKEYSKMGHPFVQWDNCNKNPKLEFISNTFVPLAILGNDENKFREAWKAYKDEFNDSRNVTAAKIEYKKIADPTPQDLADFNRLWKLTDHPKGYDIWSGGNIDPESLSSGNQVSSIDFTNPETLYDDDEYRRLLDLAAANDVQLYQDLTEKFTGGVQSKVKQKVQDLLVSAIFKKLTGAQSDPKLKSINVPSQCTQENKDGSTGPRKDNPNTTDINENDVDNAICFGGLGASLVLVGVEKAFRPTQAQSIARGAADLRASSINNEIAGIQSRQAISGPLSAAENAQLSDPSFRKLAAESAEIDAKRLKKLQSVQEDWGKADSKGAKVSAVAFKALSLLQMILKMILSQSI